MCVLSSPILFDPVDCSLPGASDGIFQARILEWVAILSSRGSSWPRDQTRVSCVSCVAGEILTSEPSGRWQFNNYTLQYLKVEPWKNLKLLFLYYSIISNHEPILIALLNKENNYRRYAHLKTFISCQLYCKFMTRLQIYSTVNHRILH